MTTGLDPKRYANYGTNKLGDTSADTGLEHSGYDADMQFDFATDSGTPPGDGQFIQNKFEFTTSMGDADPLQLVGDGNDNAEDFTNDTSGVPNVNQGETYDWTSQYGSPSMEFPHQTGSDGYDFKLSGG
jgi:hypothetical protein